MANAKVDCLLKVLGILGCKASIKQRVAILEALQELQKGETMSDKKAEQEQIPNRPPEHELPPSTKIWQGRMPHPLQSDGHCACRVVRYYTWLLRRTATQLEWQAEPEYVFEASVTRDHMGGWKWEGRDFADLPAEFFAEVLEAFEHVRIADVPPGSQGAAFGAVLGEAVAKAVNEDRQRTARLIENAAKALDRIGNLEGATILWRCRDSILASYAPSTAEPQAEPTSTKAERLLATARHEAATVERGRAMEIATTTRFDVCPPSELPAFIAERIERAASEPEPMTIAKMLDGLRLRYPALMCDDLRTIEKDLETLVKAEREREECRRSILKEAGLL